MRTQKTQVWLLDLTDGRVGSLWQVASLPPLPPLLSSGKSVAAISIHREKSSTKIEALLCLVVLELQQMMSCNVPSQQLWLERSLRIYCQLQLHFFTPSLCLFYRLESVKVAQILLFCWLKFMVSRSHNICHHICDWSSLRLLTWDSQLLAANNYWSAPFVLTGLFLVYT